MSTAQFFSRKKMIVVHSTGNWLQRVDVCRIYKCRAHHPGFPDAQVLNGKKISTKFAKKYETVSNSQK